MPEPRNQTEPVIGEGYCTFLLSKRASLRQRGDDRRTFDGIVPMNDTLHRCMISVSSGCFHTVRAEQTVEVEMIHRLDGRRRILCALVPPLTHGAHPSYVVTHKASYCKSSRANIATVPRNGGAKGNCVYSNQSNGEIGNLQVWSRDFRLAPTQEVYHDGL